MKPKLFQKIVEDMKSGIPIEMEIGYGGIYIDRDFLKLLNKDMSGKKGSFHTDEICDTITNTNPASCSCGNGGKSIYGNCLTVRLNNNKATNPDELERMIGDFNYFSKKFPDIFWQSYVNIKDEKGDNLCDWNIGSSYEKIERSEIDLMDDTSCGFYYNNSPTNKMKTAIKNCPSRGKTCKYLRRISKS